MEINRKQYMMFGVIVLLLGLQLRIVDSFVLNERATRFLAERAGMSSSSPAAILPIAPASMGTKVVRPPRWCGWCLTSVGIVLILHSLALKQSGG